MPHETTWLTKFMEGLEAGAAHASLDIYWMKDAAAVHRGIPDVFMHVAGPYVTASLYGPGAWAEFKRGHNWPTKVQAVRMAGMARSRVPVYLIQLLSLDRARVWRCPVDSMTHIANNEKYPLWLLRVADNSWDIAQEALLNRLSGRPY